MAGGPAEAVELLRERRDRLLALMEAAGAWLAAPGRREVAQAAREEFLEATGRVNEEDRSFDRRMNAFLEFLLVDYGRPARPILLESYLAEAGQGLARADKALLACLASSHRSVFVLLARTRRGIELSDLLYGGRWVLPDRAALLGVEPGEVVEARLVALPEGLVVLPSVYHHPGRAGVLARRFLEEALGRGMGPREAAAALSRRLLVRDRYPGMNLRQVYG